MGAPGEWIRFEFYGNTASGKTGLWDVVDSGDNIIGRVRWHGPWRKYVFAPETLTIWEENCLETVSKFLEAQTLDHRENLADG